MSTSSKVSECSASSKEVAENYTVIRSLGAGKFGTVKEVQKNGSKKRFAWKHIDTERDSLCEDEVRLLQRFNGHEHIVCLHEVYSEQGVLDIMLELCTSGTLYDFIKKNFEACAGRTAMYCPPDQFQIANCLQHLLTALDFLHENKVAHRDVKPENVLLSGQNKWKLADFNLACDFDPKHPMTEYAGTNPYLAPEVQQRRYTEKCDIYSMGVVFIAMVFGEKYLHPEMEEQSDASVKAQDLLSEKRWKRGPVSGARALALQMLSGEATRCTAKEALQDPWMVRFQKGMNGCCVVC
eukprot:symbB.v1.2.010288.t1/scaffold672.1/size173670/6